MAEKTGFEAMADACLAAGERVKRNGSPTLRFAMRIVLFILGRDIARRAHTREAVTNGADDKG